MKNERSRLYPVLDLGAVYEILTGPLAKLGDWQLDRAGLAGVLGYSSGKGGLAARKLSALVQFGVLDRYEGAYQISILGSRLQVLKPGTDEFNRASQAALERPALFRKLLDRYRSQGRIPENLARVLTEEHGITPRASHDAEEVFIRSARFARAINGQGRFLEATVGNAVQSRVELPASPPLPPREEAPPSETKPPMSIYLTNGKAVQLNFLSPMTVRDVEVLEDRLREEIEKGRLWDYLGLTKPASAAPESPAERPADPDNVISITDRPLNRT